MKTQTVMNINNDHSADGVLWNSSSSRRKFLRKTGKATAGTIVLGGGGVLQVLAITSALETEYKYFFDYEIYEPTIPAGGATARRDQLKAQLQNSGTDPRFRGEPNFRITDTRSIIMGNPQPLIPPTISVTTAGAWPQPLPTGGCIYRFVGWVIHTYDAYAQ
jgi:hypothetical protein